MTLQRLLVISHGHPAIQPGGGENAAYALHRAVLASPQCRSMFLAAAPQHLMDSGCDVSRFDANGDEWLMRQSDDWLHFQSACGLNLLADQWEWLREFAPSVISIHQVMHVGLDFLLRLRALFPKAKFVYTLHEFLLMCPFNGQLKTKDGCYCPGPTASGCASCLPWQSNRELHIRQLRIKAFIEAVDLFISPSTTVRDQFVRWGLCASRIVVVPNVLPTTITSLESGTDGANLNHVFAFFGNCAAAKGVDLILEAMVDVVRLEPRARLIVHGPLETVLQDADDADPYVVGVKQRLQQLGDAVIIAGSYQQSELPQLMSRIGWVVMASRWLENAPVVIQEALACRRPLLVPAIGGMAEHVCNGQDGLHFAPESAASLGSLMGLACGDPDVWSNLRTTMAPPLSSEDALHNHLNLFGWTGDISEASLS